MSYVPPPDENTLEDFAVQLLPRVFGSAMPAQRYGRSGQNQRGIDVILEDEKGFRIAAQCKAYNKTELKPAKLDSDLSAAHGITPRLDRLVVITSAPRDTALTDWAANALLHGKRAVAIWCWDDVISLMEQHGLMGEYIARIIPARHIISATNAMGLALANALAIGDVAKDVDEETPLIRDLQKLLTAGRATTVIEKLSGVEINDEPKAFILARAHAQLHENEQSRSILLGLNSTRAIALSALVHGRLRDIPASNRLISIAKERASSTELPYVTAMELMLQLVLNESILDWSSIISIVPAEARNHPTVLSALGDVATALGRHEDALESYTAADDADDRPNSLRRVAKLTNQLLLVLSKLPSLELVASDAKVREELHRIGASLRGEDCDKLDPRARAVILQNLHLIEFAQGDLKRSAAYISQALDLMPDELSLWRRWAIVRLIVKEPFDDRPTQDAPSDPELDMLLSQVEANAGDKSSALIRIERALSDARCSPELLARLHAQRILIGSESGRIGKSEAEQLLSLEGRISAPAPAIVRIIEALGDEELSDVEDDFFTWLKESSLNGLCDDDQLVVAAGLVEAGRARHALRFLPLLRSRFARADGSVDISIAPLLISVLTANLRLHEASEYAAKFASVGSVHGQFLRAQLLEKLGQASLAVDELIANESVTQSSPSLIHLCVLLARTCGRLRLVKRKVKGWPMPTPRTPSDHRALHIALAILRDGRRNALAVETLRTSEGFDEVAAAVFAVGVRSGFERSQRVSADSLVTIRTPDGQECDYWTGPSSSPLPSAIYAPWIREVVGRMVGDCLRLQAGPFAGKNLTVISTKRSGQLLLERAAQTATAIGEMRRFEGDADDFVRKVSEVLREQDGDGPVGLNEASSAALPASTMSDLLGRPARAFLRREGHWIPRCALGTAEELSIESNTLEGLKKWVIDPASLCLIIECELEHIFFKGGARPWVSRSARHMLKSWQLHEHEYHRGRRGSLHLGSRGRLILVEFSAHDRKRLKAFWDRLWRFVDECCEIAPYPSDETMAGLENWSETIDFGTLSAIGVAKEFAVSLLSDELAIRAAASAVGVSSAGLRGAILQASIGKIISLRQTVDAIAELSTTGRTFISIPFVLLRYAVLWMPAAVRESRVEALLSTMKTADPRSTWPSLLSILFLNHVMRRRNCAIGMNDDQLLRLIFRYAPPPGREIAEGIRAAVVGSTRGAPAVKPWRGRSLRSLRRAIQRYLS